MLVLKDIRFVVKKFQVSTVARLEVIMVKPGWVIYLDRVIRKKLVSSAKQIILKWKTMALNVYFRSISKLISPCLVYLHYGLCSRYL